MPRDGTDETQRDRREGVREGGRELVASASCILGGFVRLCEPCLLGNPLQFQMHL